MKRIVVISVLLTVLTTAPGAPVNFERLRTLNHDGNYMELIGEIALTKNKHEELSLPDRLKLDNYYAQGLLGCRRLEDCLKLLNTTIETTKPDSLRYYDIDAYITMNDIFTSLGLTEAAGKALDKATETLEKTSDSYVGENGAFTGCRLSLAKSIFENRRGNHQQAIKEWQIGKPDSTAPASLKLAWYGHGGFLYDAVGESARAKEYLLQALDEEAFNPNKLAVLVRLMSIENKNGHFDKALRYKAEYSNQLGPDLSPDLTILLLQVEGIAYGGLGHYEEASENFIRAIAMKDSIAEKDRILVNSMLADRIDPSEYSSLQKRADDITFMNRKTRVIAVTACIILILLLAVVLLLKRRESRRRRAAEERNTASDIEHRREKDELAERIDNQQRELIQISMAASQADSTIDAIKSEIKRKSVPSDERLKVIESALHLSAGDAALQETFRTQFASSNQQLFARLSRRHPELTKAEMNMAAYILLNISSKEIAAMTKRSVRTIDNIKYSLRKKLATNEPLHIYLRRLLEEE